MTLSIEVAPEVESALAAQAALLGVPVERYAAGVLRRAAESENREYAKGDASREERHAAIKAARGSRADLPGSVDEFLRERRACDGL